MYIDIDQSFISYLIVNINRFRISDFSETLGKYLRFFFKTNETFMIK